MANITGTPDDDTIVPGTVSASVVGGMPGSAGDTILGLDGSDLLAGGPGDDLLEGNEGDDELDGGEGDDRLEGGDGADNLFGGEGDDTLAGGEGDDHLEGDAGIDSYTGGGGADGFRVLSDAVDPVYSTLAALDVVQDFNSADGDTLLMDSAEGLLFGPRGVKPLLWQGALDPVAAPTLGMALPGSAYAASGYSACWVPDAAGGGWVVLDTDGSGTLGADDVAVRLEAASPLAIGAADFAAGTIFVPLLGTDGADHLAAIAGPEFIIAGAGADIVTGGDGDDTLVGGAGADALAGGLGIDTASYEAAARGVVASFSAPGTNAGEAAGDTFSGIENLRGSQFADRLVAAAGANRLDGLAGDDTLIGGAGADTLDGGAGRFDLASYENASLGVTASLTTAAANTGDAAGDSYVGIEALRGSAFNDVLSGDAAANRLVGLAGDDTLSGGDNSDTLIGGAGADALVGGNNSDWASYEAASSGVTVFLLAPASNTGEAAGDTFSGIENLRGSLLADRLTAGVGPNGLDGLAGDDTLDGGAGGDDRLIGGLGADLLTGGTGADTFVYKTLADSTGAASDVIADFSQAQHDRIDLSFIDARPDLAGNQAFAWIGAADFSGTGTAQARFGQDSGETVLEVDTGDGTADMVVRIGGLLSLTAADIIL